MCELLKLANVALIVMSAQLHFTIEQSKHRTKEEYESLLNSLVSKNPPPKFDNLGRAADSEFDMNEVTRVAELLERIGPENEDEWVILLKFCEDERYCISGYQQSPLAVRNISIGHLCNEVARFLVYSQVTHVYDSLKLKIPASVKFPPLKQTITESRDALIDNELKLILDGKYVNLVQLDLTRKLVEKLQEERRAPVVDKIHSFARYSWLGEVPGKREK